MCQLRSIGLGTLLIVVACLNTAVLAQTEVLRLLQYGMHMYAQDLNLPYVDGEVVLTGLYPGDTWEVKPAGDGISIRLTNHTPLDPPGAMNFKVADLQVGTRHFDVVLNNGYYAVARTGSKGGNAGGEILMHTWPTRPDGSYVPQELANAGAWSGYEFVTWTGDPVDRGYVPDPTSSLLRVHAEYFYDTGKQYYAYALFGVPTAPGAGQVSLPQTPVSLVFEDIDVAGHTILTTSAAGPGSPPGFQLGNPGTYFDISTTAVFSGGIDVSIDYSALAFTVSLDELRLFHYENDLWVDCTTSVDVLNHTIYGHVTSLSPFGVFQPSAAVIPAPGALVLLCVGLAGLNAARRKVA